MINTNKIWCTVSLLAVLSLLVSACAPVVTATPAPTLPPTTAPVAAPPTAWPTAAPTSAPAIPAALTAKAKTTYTYFNNPGDPASLDPSVDYEADGSRILLNIYEGLITFDGPDPLKFKPELAKTIPAPIPTASGNRRSRAGGSRRRNCGTRCWPLAGSSTAPRAPARAASCCTRRPRTSSRSYHGIPKLPRRQDLPRIPDPRLAKRNRGWGANHPRAGVPEPRPQRHGPSTKLPELCRGSGHDRTHARAQA